MFREASLKEDLKEEGEQVMKTSEGGVLQAEANRKGLRLEYTWCFQATSRSQHEQSHRNKGESIKGEVRGIRGSGGMHVVPEAGRSPERSE